jgi:hypothetical protein
VSSTSFSAQFFKQGKIVGVDAGNSNFLRECMPNASNQDFFPLV